MSSGQNVLGRIVFGRIATRPEWSDLRSTHSPLVEEDAVRFVCLSDIHSRPLDPRALPPADVLIVAGDFSTIGHPNEIRAFAQFLGMLPYKHKVVIAGNHECTFDSSFMKSSGFERIMGGDSSVDSLRSTLKDAMNGAGLSDPRQLFLSCPGVTYLEHSSTNIYGISIFGTPWVPHTEPGWAFNISRGSDLLAKWNDIPTNVDVLVSHTPPLGHGDMTQTGARVGCVELLNSVCSRIRPKYHVFGHVHDVRIKGAGCTTDGYTKFINACVCDNKMRPVNPPIIFDLPLPPGQSKTARVTATNRRSIS